MRKSVKKPCLCTFADNHARFTVFSIDIHKKYTIESYSMCLMWEKHSASEISITRFADASI